MQALQRPPRLEHSSPPPTSPSLPPLPPVAMACTPILLPLHPLPACVIPSRNFQDSVPHSAFHKLATCHCTATRAMASRALNSSACSTRNWSRPMSKESVGPADAPTPAPGAAAPSLEGRPDKPCVVPMSKCTHAVSMSCWREEPTMRSTRQDTDDTPGSCMQGGREGGPGDRGPWTTVLEKARGHHRYTRLNPVRKECVPAQQPVPVPLAAALARPCMHVPPSCCWTEADQAAVAPRSTSRPPHCTAHCW